MKFSVLFSSSEGNCTYIEANGTRILVDCGISRSRIADCLHHFDVTFDAIDAICLTHNHIDHVKALPVILRRHPIPVYATEGTFDALQSVLGDGLPDRQCVVVDAGNSFTIGEGLTVHPFPVPHDAADAVGYTFEDGKSKLGFVSDLGEAPMMVRVNLRGCNGLVLESNHDPTMLEMSSRPPYLKQRIRGRSGHLSNQQAAELLADVASEQLRYVVPIHLSHECNTIDLALYELQQAAGQLASHPEVMAPVYPSPLLEI